ncbi:CMRF35-like molecule 5 [Channa argus]|uniref:CMRF35-like molecule 5 n=1 Tax=Channa argus TaxID=215402 RepID=A0A6G1Q434_CHAAH|nr:CMRF35-like molecule 5 [Channa argus]
MKILCLSLLFHASLQLQCDNAKITAHIGGEFILICKYDTSRYIYSKKYWCRGDSRSSCEILVDSENVNKMHKSVIIDQNKNGIFVKVTNLQFEDTGVYWVGIDRIYADIMTSVKVVITEVPVSKPRLWALSSVVDRPTCWGQHMTVRCGCTKGTGIQYSWYQRTPHKAILLQESSDLKLHCGTVKEVSAYHCVASNDMSREESDILSVQVLMPADSNCIYFVRLPGQPIYDCADRMSTTAATSPPLSTCQTATIHSDTTNQSLQTNQTVTLFNRTYTEVPLWYTLLRWGSLVSLLIFLCIVLICTRTRHRICKSEKRKVHFRQTPHLAQCL